MPEFDVTITVTVSESTTVRVRAATSREAKGLALQNEKLTDGSLQWEPGGQRSAPYVTYCTQLAPPSSAAILAEALTGQTQNEQYEILMEFLSEKELGQEVADWLKEPK